MPEAVATGISTAMEQSLMEFRETFRNEKNCEAYLFRRRWPDGFVCRCGGRRYACLKSRAYTYECIDCRCQQSITAGTLLHRSKLSLLVWFGAIHLLTAFPEETSASALEILLKLKHNTACRLMRKLGRLIIPANRDTLEGFVAVSHTEIPLRAGYCSIIAVALELDTGRIRLATIQDDSAVAIEAFVRANVKRGEPLLTNSRKYLGLTNYQHDLLGFGAPLKRMQRVVSNAGALLNQTQTLRPAHIDDLLRDYVVQLNRGIPDRPVSFDNVLGLVLDHEPMSDWDLIGHQNPRKGAETVRRRRRRRKTATGMREDGTGALMDSPPDLMPGR